MSAPHLPKGFNRLAGSNLAAQSAEQIALAAAPLVAVISMGAGVGEAGLLQTAATLPFLLFAIPAGLMADRLPKRALMAVAETVRTASLFVILGLAFFDALTWPVLAISGFIGAAGTVVYSVAAPALVPALVPPDALPAANARIELARTVAFTAGPALAGFVVGWAGATPAFAVATALSGWAALLLLRLKEPPVSAPAKRTPFRDIREGMKFLFEHELLRPVFATQFVFNVAFFALLAVFVPYANAALDLSAAEIGGTLAAYGFGMIAGALVAPRVMQHVTFGRVIIFGPILGAIAGAIMVATTWSPSAPIAATSFFLLGFGPIIWVISTTTLRQSVTPQALLGRVSAINILAYGARPIGTATGTAVGSTMGMEASLYAIAIAFFIQAVIILRSPAAKLRQRPDYVE